MARTPSKAPKKGKSRSRSSSKSSKSKTKKTPGRSAKKSPKPRTNTASKRPSTSSSVGPSGDSKVPRSRTVVHLPGPSKAYVDQNEYRLIQLPNGIRALLISDQGQYGHPSWHHHSTNPGQGNYEHPSPPGQWNPTAILRPASRWKDTTTTGNPLVLEGFIPRTNTLRVDRDMFLDPKIQIFGNKDCHLTNEYKKSMTGCKKGHSGAMSMTINVGMTNDPIGHQGLAHFCEHMVHFGSKGYPKEDTFRNLMKDYGNGLGAFTGFMTTTYHFRIEECKIREGLDVFSNMMAFPAFKQDCISREVNSVDNEFWLSRHLDIHRFGHILVSIANKNHPLNTFPCGNLQTLRHPKDPNGLAKLQTALRSFHKKHYVGSAITLSLQTSASLDEMEEMVFDNFSKIPEGGREIRQFTEVEEDFDSPFDNPDFNKIYIIKSHQHIRRILMTWAFPAAAWKDSKNKPMDFLGVLMRDEWAGGLRYYLRKKGWIVDFDAGCFSDEFFRNEYTSLFQIGMVPTAEGMDKYTDIIQAVFAFIKRIAEIPLEQKQKLWTEMHSSTSKFFNFSGPGNPSVLTVQTSRSLQIHPGTEILRCGGNCYGPNFDDGIFMKYLTLMKPGNMNLMLIIPEEEVLTKKMKFPHSEPFTGARYAVQKFSASLMNSVAPLDINCIMPRNPYVNETVVDVGFIKPQRIARTEKLHVHHYGKNDSSVFKARCIVIFETGACNSIRGSMYLSLLAEGIAQTLLDDVSPFQRSGNAFNILTSDIDLIFDFCGFPNAMYPILTDLLTKVFNSSLNFVPEAVFNRTKDLCMKIMAGQKTSNSEIFSRIMYELETPNARSWDDHQNILESLNYKGFLSFVQLFKSSSFAFAVVAGNTSIEDGLNVARTLNNLNYNPTVGNWSSPTIGINELDSLPDNRCIRVRNPSPDNPNTVVINMYDLGIKKDQKISDIGTFLGRYFGPRMFQMLRTERQLGYVVDCGVTEFMDSVVLILKIIFPSHKRTACEVDQALDGFLVNVYHRHIKNMTGYEFSIWKARLGLLDSLTLRDIRSWYTQNLLDVIKVNKKTGQGEWRDENAGIIRKLSVQVLGSKRERCEGINRCNELQETSLSTKSLIFAQDAKNAIRPYFISDIQDYKKSPDK